MFLLYIIIGIVAGYFAGFLGMGAGCILMPTFIFLGIPYESAVDASLMSVFLSSLSATIQHVKCTGLPKEPCCIIGTAGALTAILGSFYLINIIPVLLLELLYVFVMFLTVDLLGIVKFRKQLDDSIRAIENKKYFFPYILCGGIAGLTASLLGVGGGIIIAPILMTMAHYTPKEAIKVAITTMVVTSFFSLIIEVFQNTLPLAIGIPAAIGSMIGGFLGTIALKYVRQSIIVKGNYFLSMFLGIMMLFKILANSL